MNDRRSFLKAIGAMASIPVIPTQVILKDRHHEKAQWPKILTCMDEAENKKWEVAFHRELLVSCTTSFGKGEAPLSDSRRQVLHNWFTFHEESFLLLRGICVETTKSQLYELTKNIEINVGYKYWNKPPCFLPPSSLLTVTLDKSVVFPEDMDVIVACDIAEYRVS